MRTNIVINDELMEEAKQASGLKTKKEVVERGLELIIKLEKQSQIRSLRGKINWDGNLDEIRSH